MLDLKISEKQAAIVEKLTTSGKTELDKELSTELWRLTAISEDQLRFCHGKMMEQLEKKNAQIRYGAFLLVDDLFCRSEFYRQFFFANAFERFTSLILSLKVDPLIANGPLLPRSVALKLKSDGLRAIQQWRREFRDKHPQIVSGCLFIQHGLKVDIDKDELRRIEEERLAEEKRTSLLRSLQDEVDRDGEEITSLIVEIDQCYCLLFEKNSSASSSSDSDSDSESEAARSLSIRGKGPGISSSLPKKIPYRFGRLVVTEDNEPIVENLKDLYALVKSQLRQVTDWMKRLQGLTDTSGDLTKRVESMRKLLLGAVNRYEGMTLVPREERESEECAKDSESEDDFEEVGDGSYGPEDLPILKQEQECETFSSTSSAVSVEASSSSNQQKNESPNMGESGETPVAGPSSKESCIPVESSKWTCRAIFPSGKQCPRMDRFKCPFHGKIIGRDKEGIPTDPEERLREEVEKAKLESEKPPDWQDPKHLEEIEKKTGINLKVHAPKKGKKSFSEKYPGLVDPSKQNLSRKRLARKIFGPPSKAKYTVSESSISFLKD